ncbi:hypothetical protein LX32DRAFT_710222 [Colletotrichum zoysiae]|uniref:Uncharacterized protein n=1 Tax=Colletotrichum zoysiae TaxID=1216348 RepID=A0AAD9H666_9PEZI|nr:hypothetical protein LX32DRAFT_710222 [Colletotrichum zoysiae]
MAKLPTHAHLRRLCSRFCDALDNTYLLRKVLEYRQEPFPPPGVPCLEDGPAWSEYLDRKAQEKKKTTTTTTTTTTEEETNNPSPDSEQDCPSEGETFGVVYDDFEFSVAAAARLLDVGRGRLVVRNPDRMSLLHDGSDRPVAAGGDDGSQDLLVACDPDPGEPLSDGRLGTSDTPAPSRELASPTSPRHQPPDLGDGRGHAPPPCDSSRDVCPDGPVIFWPPETARAAILIPRVRPRLVSVPAPSPLPPSPSSPAPLYSTSLSRNPRRRGVIFPPSFELCIKPCPE